MSDETTHPDAVCMASNLPCGDLSDALLERDALRIRVAELEAGIRSHWDESTNGLTSDMRHADSKLHALIGL